MPRVMTPERMDEPDVSRGELDASLKFIRRVNQHLGGVGALVGTIKRFRPDWPAEIGTPDRPLRVLDIGTGSADLPVALVRWAHANGLHIRVAAIDLHPVTLDLAREYVRGELGEQTLKDGTIELVQGDALELHERYDDRSFDYVHAGMFLHHLGDIPLLTQLAIMDRLALRGIIWNDLLRSQLSAIGIWFLTVAAPLIVKHDARVSVRKGFTPSEIRDIRKRADLGYCELTIDRLRGRFVLAGDRPVLGHE